MNDSLKKYEQKIGQFYELLNKRCAEVMTEAEDVLLDFKHGKAYHVIWDAKKKRHQKLSEKEYDKIHGFESRSRTPNELFVQYRDEPWILDSVLPCIASKGYEISMNFQAPDVFHGNLVVKVYDKWFAIGECGHRLGTTGTKGEPYLIEIWPLNYVLSNIHRLEVTLRHTKPIFARGDACGGEMYHRNEMSKETSDLFDKIDEKIHGLFPNIVGPNWSSEFYISYRVARSRWLGIIPNKASLAITFGFRPDEFTKTKLLEKLFKNIQKRVIGTRARITYQDTEIRIMPGYDIDNPEFEKFLVESYQSVYKRAQSK